MSFAPPAEKTGRRVRNHGLVGLKMPEGTVALGMDRALNRFGMDKGFQRLVQHDVL